MRADAHFPSAFQRQRDQIQHLFDVEATVLYDTWLDAKAPSHFDQSAMDTLIRRADTGTNKIVHGEPHKKVALNLCKQRHKASPGRITAPEKRLGHTQPREAIEV